MEACLVLFYLFYIPATCLSWLRSDYLPMQMTPHNWQLFTSQQTDLLLLPPTHTEAWLGFRSSVITGAWYLILTKWRHYSLTDPGLWALPMVTWSCLKFLSELVPTSTSLAWRLTASSPSKTMCLVLFPVSLRELVFWGWWYIYLWSPLCYYVAILHLSSQSLSTVLRVGVGCWMSPSASWAPSVFGGQALSRSEFRVVVSSTSCAWA